MKNRIKLFIEKNGEQLQAATLVATCVATSMVVSNTACAAGATPTEIATIICKILGGGATIGGALRTLVGFVSYSNAQDETTGAELKKAEGKIASGVMLGAVGVFVMGMSAQIAGWMTL